MKRLLSKIFDRNWNYVIIFCLGALVHMAATAIDQSYAQTQPAAPAAAPAPDPKTQIYATPRMLVRGDSKISAFLDATELQAVAQACTDAITKKPAAAPATK